MNRCSDCAFCWRDDRATIYRREPCWFCLRKGRFFSRNVRVGEQNRIDPHAPACADFEINPKEDSG